VLIARVPRITGIWATSMKVKEQPAPRDLKSDDEHGLEKDSAVDQVRIEKPMITTKGKGKSKGVNSKSGEASDEGKSGSFVNGLAVGVGIGFVATFVVVWIAVFFSPLLPAGTTYQSMLSIFIYPMVYLLAAGSIALTLGIVREYYNSTGRADSHTLTT
jgi:hypothetical protein